MPIDQTAEWVDWAFRTGVGALVLYVFRNEAKQHAQDMALVKLEQELRESLTHNDDFKELKKTVENIDRLVRLIAAKQGISPRDYE